MRFSKVFLVSLVGFGAVWITNYLLALINIQLGNASTLALYALISAAFLYFPTPKRTVFQGKKSRVEYIVNGQGELTTKIFRASNYSDYSEIEHNSEGRIFADSTGKIICTRYTNSGQNENGSTRVHLGMLCLISMGFCVMFENLLPLMNEDTLTLILAMWNYRLTQLNPEPSILHIWNNFLSLTDALSTIHLDFDFGLCFEIIKENLERLSILQFN